MFARSTLRRRAVNVKAQTLYQFLAAAPLALVTAEAIQLLQQQQQHQSSSAMSALMKEHWTTAARLLREGGEDEKAFLVLQVIEKAASAQHTTEEAVTPQALSLSSPPLPSPANKQSLYKAQEARLRLICQESRKDADESSEGEAMLLAALLKEYKGWEAAGLVHRDRFGVPTTTSANKTTKTPSSPPLSTSGRDNEEHTCYDALGFIRNRLHRRRRHLSVGLLLTLMTSYPRYVAILLRDETMIRIIRELAGADDGATAPATSHPLFVLSVALLQIAVRERARVETAKKANPSHAVAVPAVLNDDTENETNGSGDFHILEGEATEVVCWRAVASIWKTCGVHYLSSLAPAMLPELVAAVERTPPLIAADSEGPPPPRTVWIDSCTTSICLAVAAAFSYPTVPTQMAQPSGAVAANLIEALTAHQALGRNMNAITQLIFVCQGSDHRSSGTTEEDSRLPTEPEEMIGEVGRAMLTCLRLGTANSDSSNESDSHWWQAALNLVEVMPCDAISPSLLCTLVSSLHRRLTPTAAIHRCASVLLRRMAAVERSSTRGSPSAQRLRLSPLTWRCLQGLFLSAATCRDGEVALQWLRDIQRIATHRPLPSPSICLYLLYSVATSATGEATRSSIQLEESLEMVAAWYPEELPLQLATVCLAFLSANQHHAAVRFATQQRERWLRMTQKLRRGRRSRAATSPSDGVIAAILDTLRAVEVLGRLHVVDLHEGLRAALNEWWCQERTLIPRVCLQSLSLASAAAAPHSVDPALVARQLVTRLRADGEELMEEPAETDHMLPATPPPPRREACQQCAVVWGAFCRLSEQGESSQRPLASGLVEVVAKTMARRDVGHVFLTTLWSD